MILGVNGNETVNQITTGKLNVPGGEGIKDLKQTTGWRSAQFEFLLEQADQEKPNRANSPFLKRRQEQEGAFGRQDTYNRYIGELSGGDKAAGREMEQRLAEVKKQLNDDGQVPFTNKLRENPEAGVPEVSIKQPKSAKKDRSPRKNRKAKKAAKALTEEEKEQVKTQL